MDCKRIQEFIITDYIDGQMGDKQRDFIDQHLAHCLDCHDLLIRIQNEVITPFNDVHKALPDELLWVRIKQAIEGQEQELLEKSLMPGFWERLRSSVHIPRPAFVLASIVTMIFMIGTTGQLWFNTQFVKINGQDQVEYLSSLFDDPVHATVNNGNDQTPIEKYFL